MNIVIVGAGVAGVNAATKLVDNNFKGKITIIKVKSPLLIWVIILLNVNPKK